MSRQRRRFKLHRWIGLLLAIPIVMVSLSGAVLVSDGALDRLVHPARYATTGDTMLPLRYYLLAAGAKARAGERVANLVLPAPGGPVAVTLTPAPTASAVGDERGPPRTMAYLDPPSARVLDVARGGGVTRMLRGFHASLSLPQVGRTIVGLIGVAIMLSSISGLWLSRPDNRRLTRLRWRRDASTAADLHRLTGFWIALPIFVLSMTGTTICFPHLFFGQESGRFPAIMADRPVARAALAIDVVVARGAPLGPAAPLRTIVLPTERRADWTLAYDTHPMITVAVADDSGVAARSAVFAGGPESAAQIMRRLHDGTGMGWGWRVLIFLSGVLAALLAVTGAAMSWRRSRTETQPENM